MAALAPDDAFMKKMAEWRDELGTWRRAHSPSANVLKPPPKVPTVARWGRTQHLVLAAQRKAAYDHAESDRTAAHAQWQAK
eukprot:3174268-Prymnesium_polylepis.1